MANRKVGVPLAKTGSHGVNGMKAGSGLDSHFVTYLRYGSNETQGLCNFVDDHSASFVTSALPVFL